MGWVRDSEPPETIRVTFLVSKKEHPELARFIWSLPYRKASSILRDILSSAAKSLPDEMPREAPREIKGSWTDDLRDKFADEATKVISVMNQLDEMFSK